MLGGVVLAGGQSTRMGKNKALLPFKGVPLVEHMQQLAIEAGCRKIYISGDLEGYDCISDACPSQGPVGGIISSFMALNKKYKALLFLPTDMPLLTPEILQRLIRSSRSDGVHYLEHPLPFLLNVTKAVHHYFENLRESQISVFQLLRGLDLLNLPIFNTDANAFLNVNTPQSYRLIY